MRNIKYIVVHTTATLQSATVESIQNYWKNHLGWKSPGYHIVISPDGTKHRLLDDDKVSNGVGGGYNTPSLNVSYVGGILKGGKAVDNRTDEQKQALIEVLSEWKSKYPNAEILGHRDFFRKYGYDKANKACPCFNAVDEYNSIK